MKSIIIFIYVLIISGCAALDRNEISFKGESFVVEGNVLDGSQVNPWYTTMEYIPCWNSSAEERCHESIVMANTPYFTELIIISPKDKIEFSNKRKSMYCKNGFVASKKGISYLTKLKKYAQGITVSTCIKTGDNVLILLSNTVIPVEDEIKESIMILEHNRENLTRIKFPATESNAN